MAGGECAVSWRHKTRIGSEQAQAADSGRRVVGCNVGEFSDVRRVFKLQSLQPLQQKQRCL